MFKPRVYKSNGMEAYHLVNDEGGSFLYEGTLEYSDAELFKDEQGRAFYRVTSDIAGPSRYYVEVEPEAKPIPMAPKGKAISDLIRSTPGEKAPREAEPEVAPGPVEEAAQEPVPEPVASPMETSAPEVPKETCFETPEAPAEGKPTTTEEAQAAVKAMASLGEHRPHKKSNLPLYLALLLVALIVVAGAAVAAFRPDLVSGILHPATPTPEPTPTPTPTTEPTAEPTVTPEPPTTTPGPTVLPGSEINAVLMAIAPFIDGENPLVVNYSVNHSDPLGTSTSKLALMCDLYDDVNGKWANTGDNDTPQNLNRSVEALSGSPLDYSVFMASLAEAVGMESRVVAFYDYNASKFAYYPEIKVALNDSSYDEASTYMRARYAVFPYDRKDGVVHWLGMAMGKTPGVYIDSKYGKSINSRNEIYGV